jgi:NAD-dependent deacetylase
LTQKKKLVVLSGAGISAESGIPTFRDAGGLWEGHRIEDVATPEAWQKNPQAVLEFYNLRRKTALNAMPNAGHFCLAELEEYFEVTIITQNVDNLHERAGSSHVIHLHGNLFQSRSTLDSNLIYDMDGWALNWGDSCEKGSQLRPHIVWFGELVPEIENAAMICSDAEIFLVVGTSLQVYPAAGLIDYVPNHAPKFLIDPNARHLGHYPKLEIIAEKAGSGLPALKESLLKEYL